MSVVQWLPRSGCFLVKSFEGQVQLCENVSWTFGEFSITRTITPLPCPAALITRPCRQQASKQRSHAIEHKKRGRQEDEAIIIPAHSQLPSPKRRCCPTRPPVHRFLPRERPLTPPAPTRPTLSSPASLSSENELVICETTNNNGSLALHRYHVIEHLQDILSIPEDERELETSADRTFHAFLQEYILPMQETDVHVMTLKLVECGPTIPWLLWLTEALRLRKDHAISCLLHPDVVCAMALDMLTLLDALSVTSRYGCFDGFQRLFEIFITRGYSASSDQWLVYLEALDNTNDWHATLLSEYAEAIAGAGSGGGGTKQKDDIERARDLNVADFTKVVLDMRLLAEENWKQYPQSYEVMRPIFRSIPSPIKPSSSSRLHGNTPPLCATVLFAS